MDRPLSCQTNPRPQSLWKRHPLDPSWILTPITNKPASRNSLQALKSLWLELRIGLRLRRTDALMRPGRFRPSNLLRSSASLENTTNTSTRTNAPPKSLSNTAQSRPLHKSTTANCPQLLSSLLPKVPRDPRNKGDHHTNQ